MSSPLFSLGIARSETVEPRVPPYRLPGICHPRLRWWLGSVLIVLCLLAAVAAAPALASPKERIVFWYGATQDERAAYEQMIRDFNRMRPRIEVRGMLVPQGYVERKLLLSVVGGVPPDVVRFYTHLGGEMMSRGGLEPLDDLVARDRIDLSDFYPVSIEQNTFRGRLYGMPWILSPNALFYNRKLFREVGLDPNRPPRNWAEVERYALRLTVRSPDGGIERVGYANFLNNPPDFHLQLWQRGGSPLTPDLRHPAFDRPEGIEALTWMRDFLIKEAGPSGRRLPVAKSAKEALDNLRVFSSTYVGATQDPFGLEKLAMRIDSPFRIPDLKKYFPRLDYGVAPVPYDRIRTLEAVGNSLVIPRGSLHREAAWEFIKFAASREQALRICGAAGRIPARRSAATSPQFYGNPLVRPFVDQIEYARTTPVAPGYREASDALARNIEKALQGKLSPEAALHQAAVKAEEILAEVNEDVTKYPLIPWAKVAIAAGLALAAAIGGLWYYVLRRTKGSRMARREAATFYLFLSPWLVGFVILTFGATAASLLFSFSRWDVLSPARFVGFGNFAKLVLRDPRFVRALGNTLYYAAFSIPLAIVGGLAIGVLMNQKLKGIRLFRTVYYLPAIVSGVATALLWQWIFSPKAGLLNRLLEHVVAKPPQWLLDPQWSKPAFIVMALWGVGGAMIIYLAGLQGIPEEFYEAAKIDGANAWQRFRNVTLPLLTPAIFYQLIIGTIAALQFFTPAYIMTGGGPDDSTLFFNLYLFKNSFEFMKVGYASAMAWILFVIVLGITLLQLKSAARWVYYEGKAEE